jgi:LPXTG-motif cell wall-anchored protein
VLVVSQGELDVLSIAYIGAVPLLLLIVGGAIAWRRRRA